ncbi:MAG: sulfotransferase domain-containing protein [Candidatus Sulfotelmatobacter sp.]
MKQTYRLVRAKAARSRIRVPWVWSWHLGLRSQDAFLASFPRSGSTWLRFMLYEVLSGEDAGFRKIEDRLPEIHKHRGGQPILPDGGRLIKTHENYRSDYKRAVLLVRDVRDVFLSVYNSYLALDMASFVSKGDIDSFLHSFLEGRVIHTGSWQQHTRSWLESPLAKNGNLLVVRYEDLRKNPEPKLQELLQFVGINADVRVIRRAIENNTLQQMRAKEDKAKKAGEHSILLGSRTDALDETSRFVRKGAVGGWREKLTDAQVKIFEQYSGDTLETLGYEPGLVRETVYSPSGAR